MAFPYGILKGGIIDHDVFLAAVFGIFNRLTGADNRFTQVVLVKRNIIYADLKTYIVSCVKEDLFFNGMLNFLKAFYNISVFGR